MARKNMRKSKSNSVPKLNSSNSKIVKPKHVRLVKRPLYLRRSSRLNPFPFVFGTHSPDLQAIIGRQILSNFDPIQQLKFRAVSPMWDYNVRLGCRQVRELVLNFSSILNFEISLFSSNEHVNKVVINMKEEELLPSTIDLLGKLYCNIEELRIIYGSIQDAEKLFKILQHFTKVTKFTCMIYKQITIENFLHQLFTTINDHLAPLTTLNLFLRFQNNEKVQKLEVEQFTKTLSFLQNLFCSFNFDNKITLFEIMGKDLPPHLPLHTLFVESKFEMSQIAPMFEHNRKLSQLRKFQLDMQRVDVLDCFLSHLPKLEYLSLNRMPELVEERFSIEYIRAIRKLTNLEVLIIDNFQPMTINQLSESLSGIRLLRVKHNSFFENIESEWHLRNGEHVQSTKIMYKPFVENFAKQFPNVEELNISTRLSKTNEFKKEFIDLCKKEFKYLNNVYLEDHLVSIEKFK